MVKLPLAIRRALCGSSGFDSRPRDSPFAFPDTQRDVDRLVFFAASRNKGRRRHVARQIGVGVKSRNGRSPAALKR